jgi:hypothetical protein
MSCIRIEEQETKVACILFSTSLIRYLISPALSKVFYTELSLSYLYPVTRHRGETGYTVTPCWKRKCPEGATKDGTAAAYPAIDYLKSRMVPDRGRMTGAHRW